MDNYSGKTIYLGIDVHKRTYSVTAICDGIVVKSDRMLAVPLDLIEYCRKFFRGATIHSAYEAGFGGFDLHRKLVAAGIINIVVNPASIEIVARERAKTDKRDSRKIAEQLSTNRLRGIHVPSVEREQLRLISRFYETLVRHRRRVGCQIKSLLYQFGLIPCTSTGKTSKRWIRSILKLKCLPALEYNIKELAKLWLALTRQMQGARKELELQAQADGFIHECYDSFFGVGLIATRMLANELEDMSQFSNEKKLSSFAGLTPQEYSSGEHHYLGHITHQGRPNLRKILVQIAWTTIKKDPQLKEVFNRISARAGAKKAIVAVARKLLSRMRACLREKRTYEIREVTCLREDKNYNVKVGEMIPI